MEILHTIGLHVGMPWLVGGINCGLGSGASCTYRETLMAVVEPSWLKKESRLLAAFPTTDLYSTFASAIFPQRRSARIHASPQSCHNAYVSRNRNFSRTIPRHAN
jgi:hypothetical protein